MSLHPTNMITTPAATLPTDRDAFPTSFGDYWASMKDEPVYVILGVQGSGTNLLRSILSKAFNFSVVQDQSLVYNAALELGSAPSRESVRRQFERIQSRVFPSALGRKTLRRIKTNSSFEGIAQHFDPAEIKSGADLARFVYAYSAFLRGSRLMAIKSDDLWETIGHIDTVLPNRRVILLTRDFRDNLLSITNKDWGPIDPLMAARYVKERFSYYDAEFRRTRPEHRLHVRYEDLLEAPDEFVTRFREQFGLGAQGWTPAPVDKSRIRRNNTKKWARLPGRMLAHCEFVLRGELQAYGYGTECDPPEEPGVSTWMLARGRDAVKRVPQKLRGVGRRIRK